MQRLAKASLLFLLLTVGAFSQFSHAAATIGLCVSTHSGLAGGDCPTGDGLSPPVAIHGAIICRTDSGVEKCIAVSMDGKNDQFPVPTGWPAVNTPPSSATATNVHFDCSVPPGIAGNNASSAGGCAAQIDANMIITYGNADRHVCSFTVGGTICQSDAVGSCASPTCSGSMTQVVVCPTGYSGPSCALTAPSSVQRPSDNTVNVKRTGNVFSVDPQDAADAAQLATDATINTNTVSLSNGVTTHVLSIDTLGRATVYSSTLNPDNTSTARTITTGPTSAAPGVPIIGNFVGTYLGTGQNAPLAPTGTATCGAAGQPACNMAISEAGTPSGATAFDAANARLGALSPSALGVTAWTGITSAAAPPTELPSLGGDSGCSGFPIHWVFMGHDMNLNWCTYYEPFKAFLAWLLYAMTGIYIWRRITGASSAGS